MGIRDTLNEKPIIAYATAGGLIVIALLFIVFYGFGGTGASGDASKAFYSVDDGKNYFADAIDKPSPFDKDGKKAYRVSVWKGKDGKPFVSHLERDVVATASSTGGKSYGAQSVSREVKRPGTPDSGWASLNSAKGQEIMSPVPKGGGEVESVSP